MIMLLPLAIKIRAAAAAAAGDDDAGASMLLHMLTMATKLIRTITAMART